MPPGNELRMQGAGSLGLCRRQIMFLARIVMQIIKLDVAILKKLQQLPVARADRAGRRRAPSAAGRGRHGGADCEAKKEKLLHTVEFS